MYWTVHSYLRISNKNLVLIAILSKLSLGNTRLLPWHSRLGSICVKNLHSGVPPPTTESNRSSVPVIWQNQARRLPEVHPEYNATQHQGEDPTGKPDTPYPQH
ncbi:hypothetical protein TNCV_2316691 [Trichonephila clavipes]|nr:hypothetical protein TNCV_2316691 [Trichonephila clavipes]